MRQIVCALAALFVICASSAGQSSGATARQSATGANPVEHITLPDYAGKVLPGPNVDVYRNNCLICHSARYVTTQPEFPRSVWTKEVKKMVDSYGAKVSDADQAKIVDYLVAVRGAPESNAQQSAH